MPPEWVIILFAIGAIVALWRDYGGKGKAFARLWLIAFYLFLWLGPDTYNALTMIKLSRWGLILILITDIIPALFNRKRGSKHDADLG